MKDPFGYDFKYIVLHVKYDVQNAAACSEYYVT